MSDNKTIGLGLLDVLLIVFIALKLAHLIDWSWWWVLSPCWGQFVLAGVGLLLVGFAKWVARGQL